MNNWHRSIINLSMGSIGFAVSRDPNILFGKVGRCVPVPRLCSALTKHNIMNYVMGSKPPTLSWYPEAHDAKGRKTIFFKCYKNKATAPQIKLDQNFYQRNQFQLKWSDKKKCFIIDAISVCDFLLILKTLQ